MKRFLLVAWALSLGVATGAHAQSTTTAAPAAGGQLSAMDYIQIELLAARQADGWDTGADYGYQFADTFTDDGEFIVERATTTGRTDLAALARTFTKANPMYVGRIIANHLIEPSPGGASGYLYQVIVDKTERKGAGYSERLGSAKVIQSGGLVRQTYVRTPAGWRIRRHEPVASASLMSVTSTTGRGPAAPTGLTAEDNVAIRQLVTRYAYALDSASNGATLADLFAADGELVIAGKSFKGRDAIAEVGKRGWADGQRPANAASHFLTNHIVEMSANGPVGKQFMIKAELALDRGPGKGFTMGGHYQDQYVRTPAGWRFQRRVFIADENDKNATVGVYKGPLPAVTARSGSADFTPGVLTADDYVEIRQLDSHYGFAVDLWAADANGLRGDYYAQIYTPDGEVHAAPQRIGGLPVGAKGTVALRRIPGGGGGPNFMNHYNFNRLIEPTATGARGKVVLLVIFAGHDGAAADITVVGHYAVEYRKTPQGWRIHHRDFFASTPDLGEAHMTSFK
jgi:hypothetical protein